MWNSSASTWTLAILCLFACWIHLIYWKKSPKKTSNFHLLSFARTSYWTTILCSRNCSAPTKYSVIFCLFFYVCMLFTFISNLDIREHAAAGAHHGPHPHPHTQIWGHRNTGSDIMQYWPKYRKCDGSSWTWGTHQPCIISQLLLQSPHTHTHMRSHSVVKHCKSAQVLE